MANNDNSDYNKKRMDLFKLLPSVHQSDTNLSIFENTFNRFLSKPETKKISGFAGRGNPGSELKRQIEEPTVHRQAYQLQPILHKKIGTIEHMASYKDILNEVSRVGVDINRLPLWGNALQFNWIPPVDLNKFLHFQDYFWVDKENPGSKPQYITIKSECTTAEAIVSAYEQMIEQIGGFTFDIIGIDAVANTFTVKSSLSEVFIEGFIFTTKDSTNSSINNAIWTTASSKYDDTTDQTTIVVVENIVSDTPVDGVVSLGEFFDILRFNKNCICEGTAGWGEGGWDDNQVGAVLWFDAVRTQILVDPNNRPTSAINGNIPAEPFDLWWDSTADILYQLPPSPTVADPLDGTTWTIIFQNFSSLADAIDGTFRWNFRTSCQFTAVQTDAADQWIDANKWVHKNDVKTFGIAKKAQLPIIEFFSTLELNEWSVTLHKWKYRSISGTTFEDSDTEPDLWEIAPLEFFTYDAAKNEIIFDERYGDMTSFMTPDTFVVFKNSITGINGARQIISSHFGVNHVSVSGVSLNRTRVIFDTPFGALDDDDGVFVPVKTSKNNDTFVDYDIHWVYAGIENILPINHQTKNSLVEVDPTSTVFVDENYTYQTSPFAQDFLVTVDNTDLFVLDGDPRPGATRTRRQLSLLGTNDVRVYKNNVRLLGDFDELSEGDLIESFVFKDIVGVETPPNGIAGTPRWFLLDGPDASLVMTIGMQLFVEESGEADGRYLLADALFDIGTNQTRVRVAPQEFLINNISPPNDIITVDGDSTDYHRVDERIIVFGHLNPLMNRTFLISSVLYDSFNDLTTIGVTELNGTLPSIGTPLVNDPGGVNGSVIWGSIPTNIVTPFGEITASEGEPFSADNKFIAAIRLNTPVNRTDKIRIEVGEASEDDLGRFSLIVRTIEDDVTFQQLGPECISHVRFRKTEQVKVENNQYPLFDLYNIDGSSANQTESIIRYATNENARLDTNLGLRIVKSADGKNFGFEQMLIDEDDGPMLFYRDLAIREDDFWANSEHIPHTDEEHGRIMVRFFNCDAWETRTHMGRFYAEPIVSDSQPTVASHPQFEGVVGPNPTGALEDGLLWFDLKTQILYCHDNQAPQGSTFPWVQKEVKLSFADPTTTSMWRPGLNKEEYIPTYRDRDRQADGDSIGTDENGDPILLSLPVGDPAGDWELANQLFFNACHENRKCFHLTQMVRHINTIVDEQIPVPGVLGNPRDRWRTIQTPNFGLGGTIKDHNDSYDSFLSSTFINNVTVPTLIEFANEQYEVLLKQIEDIFKTDVVGILTNLSTDFRMLEEEIPGMIIEEYENNIAQAFVYGDTTAFDGEFGVRNWIATLPLIHMVERVKPVINYDPVLGFRELLHHDGHRSSVQLAVVLVETIIQRVIGTIDPRSTVVPRVPEPFGRQSILSFPTTYQTFINPTAPNFFSDFFRSNVFWFEANGPSRRLWHLLIDHISVQQPTTSQPDGTLWLDLGTLPNPTLNELVSNVWIPVTTVGDGIITSAWTEINIRDLFALTMLETEDRLYEVSPPTGPTSTCPLALHRTAFAFDTLTVTPEEAEVKTNCLENQFLDFVREIELGDLPFSVDTFFDATDPFTWNYTFSTMSVDPFGFTGIVPTPGNICTIVATAGQTNFSCSYTPGFVQVFVNGTTPLVDVVDFTATNGTDVVLTIPALAGDTYNILDFAPNPVPIPPIPPNLIPGPPTGPGGVPSPGGVWQDLYTKLYGTPYPHLEPWVLQGYREKPTWWDDEYKDTTGTRRWIYTHATTTGMWENIRVGRVPVGRFYPDGSLSSGISAFDGQTLPTYVYFSVNIGDVPVDNGTIPFGVDDLLPPFWNFEDEPTLGPGYLGPIRSTFFLLNFEIVDPGAEYAFGDRGPVEWGWTVNSRRGYDELTCAYIMQPIRFVHFSLGEEFAHVNCLQVSIDQSKVYTSKDAIFHGDLVDGNKKAKKSGLLQWYVNFNRFTETDMNASDFRPLWSGWRAPLAYQFASFLDTSSLFITSTLFDITTQDFQILAKRSPGIENHIINSFNITVTEVPPAILQFNNEAAWRFSVNSLSPIGTQQTCYGVQNYPFRVDPDTQICTIYQFNIVESRSNARRIAIEGNAVDAFSAGTAIEISGFSKDAIIAVNTATPSFVVAGDVTSIAVVGQIFQVSDSVGDPLDVTPVSKNGTYTVVSSLFAAGVTTIIVAEPIPDDFVDGNINLNNNGIYTVERSQFAPSLNWTLVTLNEPLPDVTDPASGQITADFRKLPWVTGDEIFFFSTRQLPAPLRRDTQFNVIVLNDTQFHVAESSLNAALNDFLFFNSEGQGQQSVGKIRSTFFALAGQTTQDIWYHHEIDKTFTSELSQPFAVNGAQKLIDIIDGCVAFSEDEGFRFNESKLLQDSVTGRLIDWQFEEEDFLDFIHRLRVLIFKRSERFEVSADIDTNVFTFTGQVPMFGTGQRVILISNGALPPPLIPGEPVFYINVSNTQFAVAATIDDAQNGVPVDLISAGSGQIEVQSATGTPRFPSREVNAFRDAIWFRPSRGIVADVVRGPFPDVRIDQLFYDQNGEPLRETQLKIFRQDEITEIRMKQGLQNPGVPLALSAPLVDPRTQFLHISGSQLFIDGHEHVVLFNDCTTEDLLIYDAWAGLNTPRVDMEFDRQPVFTQRPNLGGHFLTVDGELKRNPEANAFDIQTFYDTHVVSETLPTSRYARNLLGYEGIRNDLTQLRINPKSQFIFWRGMIHKKGTQAAVTAFTQSRRFISANVDDYWAFKLASFGDAGCKEYPAVKLFTDDAKDNELVLRFLNPEEEDLISIDPNTTFVVDPGLGRPEYSERWDLQPSRIRELSDTALTLFFQSRITDPTDFGSPITFGYDVNPYNINDSYDLVDTGLPDVFFRHDFDSDRVVITYKLYKDGTQETVCPSVNDITIDLTRKYLPNTGGIRVYRRPAVGEGRYLTLNVDYLEVNSSQIQIEEPAALNDKFTIIHRPGILNEIIDINTSDPGYDIEEYDTALYDDDTIGTSNGQYERVNAKVVRFPMQIDDVVLLMTTFIELTLHASNVSKAAHNPVEIIDTGNDQRISFAPIWDPARDRHYHIAESILDFQSDEDQARYTTSLNPVNVTFLTLPADVVGSLSGTFWRIWSGGDKIAYYVWYDVAARPEVTEVTIPADTAGSLDGTHWNMFSANDTTSYYVWYDVDGGGNDPLASGTPISVVINSNDTALVVATATAAAIDAVIDFNVPIPTTDTITITNANNGSTTNIFNVNTGIIIGTIIQGLDVAVDPNPGGNAIPVVVAGDSSAITVAITTAAALDALDDFNVPVPGNADIVITNSGIGITSNTIDDNSGVVINEIIQARVDDSFWHTPEVGEVWFDTSRVQYVPYFDDKVFPVQQDRLDNWGRLADWASVKIYEWFASDVPPEEYDELAEREQGNLLIDDRLKKSGTVRSHAFRRDRDNFEFTTQPQTFASSFIVIDSILGDVNSNTTTGLNFDHSQSFRATGGETTFRLSRPYVAGLNTLAITVNGQSLPATLPGPTVLTFTEEVIPLGDEGFEFTVSTPLNLDDLVVATITSPNYGVRIDIGSEIFTFVESGTNLETYGDLIGLLERDIKIATFDLVDNTLIITANEIGIGQDIRVIDTTPIGGLPMLENLLIPGSLNVPSTGPLNPGTFPADDTSSQTNDGVNTLFTTLITPHVFVDNDLVILSTTRELPNGLTPGSVQFTIWDSNQLTGTFRLRDSEGDVVEVLDAGIGVHTVADIVWPTNLWRREVDVRESYCVLLDHDLRSGVNDIASINQGTPSFDVAGDQTLTFLAGDKFTVINSSANDGVYTIVSSSFDGTRTTIVVEESILDVALSGRLEFSRSFDLTKFEVSDEVKVYVNGHFMIDFIVPADLKISRFDIQDAIGKTFDFAEQDNLDVVRFAHIPTEEELEFDPDIADNGTIHTQFVIRTDHSIVQEVQPDGTLKSTFYFWVENSARTFERPIAPRQAQRELAQIPIPYSVFLDPHPLERVIINDVSVPFPDRYTTIAVRGLRGIINSDDRYILRFTRDFTLRNRGKNGEPHGNTRNWLTWNEEDTNVYNTSQQSDMDLKKLYREWEMFREKQINHIPRHLWDKLTEAVVGNKIGDPSIRVPSLAAELYDRQFETQERIGLEDGQTFLDRETGLATILADLNNPQNDFKPVNIEVFLLSHSFDTPENIEKAMQDMFNTFTSTHINRIFFSTLLDAHTFKDKYSGLLKTSMVSIHGVRILEVNGVFDD